MDYVPWYFLFGLVFVGAAIAYWLVTRPLRDPEKIYASAPSEPSTPQTQGAES